ncbi:DUF6894 family protein [Rhizobium laguerreae]|uniref:DUF6894 family protein n=1 Tax=Rhizobium laguerreae TaxID=1076926 RepID=UPI0014421868|nr:hypothetical protein [Rhizobium laguerreae]
MPTYYLHVVHADRVVPDLEGSTFGSLEAARHEANESLRELVGHALLSNRPEIPQRIDLWDETENSSRKCISMQHFPRSSEETKDLRRQCPVDQLIFSQCLNAATAPSLI